MKACALYWCIAIPNGKNSHCKFHFGGGGRGGNRPQAAPPISRELELRFRAEFLNDKDAASKLVREKL